MSFDSIYTSRIENYDSFIEKKKDENEDLARREDTQQELLDAQEWETYNTKRNLRKQKEVLYSFLRKNGGIFNLNEEQKNFYSGLLLKCNNLKIDFSSSRNIEYNLRHNVIGLQNRQQSNYLSLFNASLDKGKYLTQQSLFQNYTQDLG